MKTVIQLTCLFLFVTCNLMGQTNLIVETVNTPEVATFQCTNSTTTQIDFLGNYALNGSGYNALKRAYIQTDNQHFRIGLSTNNINGSLALATNGGDRVIVQPDGDVSVTGYLNLSNSANTGVAGDMRYNAGTFEGHDGSGWKPLSGSAAVTQKFIRKPVVVDNDSDDYYFQASSDYGYHCGPTNDVLNYDIELPSGSNITKIEILFYQKDATDGLRAGIKAGDGSNVVASTAFTTGVSSIEQVHVVYTGSLAVNYASANQRFYTVAISPFTEWSPFNTNSIVGVLVTYN